MNPGLQYLYDSSGNWVAFRINNYVFDKNVNWIGWLPWGDSEVVNPSGSYLGHIFPNNRLYKKGYTPYRGYPGYPPFPGYPGYPSYPGYAGYSPLPIGVYDVDLNSKEGA